jgi:hypothetical protein
MRVKDPELLKRLHLVWDECVIADGTCKPSLSLHHIHKHPRDDLEENLAMLCGDGVTGHHGLIESHDRQACAELAAYLIRNRLDTMEYLGRKLGGVNAVREWMRNQLHADDLRLISD